MKISILILIVFTNAFLLASVGHSQDNFLLTEKSSTKDDKKKSGKDDFDDKNDDKSKESLREKLKEKIRSERDKREGGRFGDKRF